MMLRRACTRLSAVAVLGTAVLTIAAGPASAHEHRAVGDFQFTVGWGDEPSYTGFKNSVQLLLSDKAGKPITDVTDTVKAEVSLNGQNTTVAMEPAFKVGVFGTPGDYRGWLTPTRPGAYTFHFTGTIHGQAVDQSFTGSDTTFNPVKDVNEIEFPAKDPSTGQLAQRLDRALPRLQTADAAQRSSLHTTRNRVALLTALAIAGLALGLAGVATAAVAMRRAR